MQTCVTLRVACRHRAVNASSLFAASPSLTCARADATSQYELYTGDSSAAQQSDSTYYLQGTNATRGWRPSSCTATYSYVCRASAAALHPCNATSPPPALPPSPPVPAGSTACRQLKLGGSLLRCGLAAHAPHWHVSSRCPLSPAIEACICSTSLACTCAAGS